MAKTKIALIIRGFHRGGIERVFEEYYSHMDLSPYEIHIITNMENIPEVQEKFEKMGCIIHALSPMKGHRFSLKNIKEYDEIMKNGHFDVVHNNVPDNLFPLYFAKKYKVPKRILHSHNIYTEDFAKKKKIVADLYRLGFKMNASNATHLISVSRRAAESAFAKRASEAVLLKNAITIDKFAFNSAVREVIRAQLGIGEGQILFGHVGRYETNQKNQEFVLELYKEILKKYANSKLVMLGDGSRRQEFVDMAKELGISEQVVFTGNVPNVNEYLSAMDVYLFPSRKEGLPVAGVEAQASGVKCIFSDRIPEEAYVVKDLIVLSIDGDLAITNWLEAVDRVVEQIGTENVANRLDVVSQINAAGFSIDDQVLKLKELYQV